jgi:hypothetical protein
MKPLQKPNEGFYLDLLEVLLLPDYVSQSSFFQSQFRKDLKTICSRVSCEGFQFCTKTLPKLGKALERGLVEGQFQCPSEFKTKKDTKIPTFMWAFFALVFNCEDGKLLPDARTDAIKHLLQVLFWYYKLELPYDDKTSRRVLDAFVEAEEELGQFELACAPDSNIDVRIASELTAGTIYDNTAVNIFGNFHPMDILPKHGPGAVATGEKGEQKWKFSRLYNPIHTVYPYWQYTMMPGVYASNNPEESISHLTPTEFGTAKVVLVPKDSRGPRLISSEPLEYMWFQQGLGGAIVSHLETACRFTRGQINFSSQSINRLLALTASTREELRSDLGLEEIRAIKKAKLPIPFTGGTYVTLDLKEASDRVGLSLVKGVFSKTPLLSKALLALRSTATVLPDGRTVFMKKYAPMGSALCFPVEAYCFWILIVAAVSRNRAQPLLRIMKRVFVYGDDIIVPSEYASEAVRVLESVGLKVNLSKSCLTGEFRESCGMNAFRGVDVTPIRVKTRWTGKSTDTEAFVSYVALANNMRKRGYESVYQHIKSLVESVYGIVPYGLPNCGYISWEIDDYDVMCQVNSWYFKVKWSLRYQAWMHRVRRVGPKTYDSTLEGYDRLLRDLTSGPGSFVNGKSVYSLPRESIIRRGWSVAS